MNALKAIVTAGAVLALAAPAANATFDRALPYAAQHAKVGHHKRIAAKRKATKPRVLIIVAAPTPMTTQPSAEQDCAIYDTSCTDAQLCDFYGVNCDLVAVTQESSTAAEKN